MLSGNGRHRRPRQAPAIIVAAGVTGSAIAIPLLGAASAHAADGTTWDKVAECESDGAWSADIGNGRYGGLQITQADWEKYGGLDYAARADQASRQQQIAVAEKILADQGPSAWPSCGALSGLNKSSGSTTVDTGVAGDDGSGSSSSGSQSDNSQSGNSDSSGSSDKSGSSESSSSSDSSDSSDVPVSAGLSDSSTGNSSDSGAGSSTSSGSKSGNGKSDKSGSSGSGVTDSTGSTASGSTGSQSPSASPAESAAGDAADDSWRTGGISALVDTGALGSGRHRGASADDGEGGLSSDSTGGRHASQTDDTYTVRTGDSLVSIADALDLDGGWRHLYTVNKKTIGSDPDRITAGQTLEIGS